MCRHLLSTAMYLCLFLFSMTVYAAAGCCSHHGGVKGCQMSTGYELCNDGTTSPSCKCGKASKSYYTPKAKQTQTTTTKKTTVKTEETAPVTDKKSTNITGCCSRHGGIARCNKSTGFYMCKDKTMSATCTCH